MHLSAHGASHPGRRSSNEDALYVDPAVGLFIVADGMGGHNAGEVAAHLAIDAITEFVMHSRNARDLTWPYGLDPELSLDGNRLRNAIHLANNRVIDAAESRSDYAGMGTTVVAAIVNDGRLVFVGVGDSRVYVSHEGTMQQLTQDDSWVATVLAREPGVSETALAQHPMRHVLTNVVGGRSDAEPEVAEHTFLSGDVLLLCSDGLHGSLTLDDIAEVLRSGGSCELMTASLIERALANGATDNVTAVVVQAD
jgi:serine/threonine protein phosphatase PrpC